MAIRTSMTDHSLPCLHGRFCLTLQPFLLEDANDNDHSAPFEQRVARLRALLNEWGGELFLADHGELMAG